MIVKSIQTGKRVAEIEISFIPHTIPIELPHIQHSYDAYAIFIEKWNMSKICLIEEFKALFLNRANRVLGICSLSTGGVASTVIEARVIMAIALKIAATGIILAHNHPSGFLKPSNADIQVTKSIKEAGNLLNIQLLDHLIISQDRYYSFADEGAL